MFFTTRNLIVGSTALLLTVASAAHGQTLRASCDNRQGRGFADVIDSSDPNDSSFNVDPSEMYRTINGLYYPNTQTVGVSTATASLNVSSRFLGNNPSQRCGGFIMDDICQASATRGAHGVLAFSNDTEAVCLDVGAVSASNPLRMRLSGSIVISGGATGRLRLQSPTNQDIINITGGSINKVVALTTPGTYRFTGSLDTGNVQPTSGTQTRYANVYASFVCMADVNGSGAITVQDIFDFLSLYFAGNLAADANASGAISVQDIFDFLAQYFQGCNF